MRTKNTIRNSLTATLSSIITMLFGFVSTAIFIRILNIEYLGISGLFSNILTMLSFFELGIGSAIIYNLYKPIANKDIEEIKSLMSFYKKAYDIIALSVLFVGLLILPFLNKLVGEVKIDINIYIVYILYLLSTVSSYVIAYKRSILYANEKNYIINLIHIIYICILNITQMIALYLTRNYYLYLSIKIICQLVENIIINFVANKRYPYLLEKQIKTLDKKVKKNIFSKVKALIYHKVGYIIVSGTDNIIISYYFGVIKVGLYSNYYQIIGAVSTLATQFINSSTASVGNLLVTKSTSDKFETFKKIRFLNFWIATFCAISFLSLIQPFIRLWVGNEYLLELVVVYTLTFNLFQKIMRSTYNTFKDAAGIWEEDKYVPIIESIMNIIFSIILLKVFGIAGVFMGTIASGLILWGYSYPKFIYKKIFNRNYLNYFFETIGYILLFVFLAIVTYGLSIIFSVTNDYIQLIINTIICLTIPNLLIIMLFHNNENYKYYNNLLLKFIKKKK